MGEDYGDVWVCTDCYFAHHYGRSFVDGLWFAGEDPEPVGGRHLIDQGDLSHNIEPLRFLNGFDRADNTCSNHYYGQGCEVDEDGKNVEPCDHCGSSEDGTGIDDFSHAACDGCHSNLGGSRHRLHIWKREETNA